MTPDLIIGFVVLATLLVLEGQIPFYQDLAHRAPGHRLRHAVRNSSLALINAGIALVLTPLLIAATALSADYQIGILHWVEFPGAVGVVVTFVAAVLLFDLWMYGWHRANHRLPFLWRFHKVHHTDTAMDATTALRFHPGELLLSSLANPMIVLLLGVGLAELTLYKILMLPVILFHHSNVAVSPQVEARLRAWIVPPSMHRVHHSRRAAETNANFGTIFPFWDKLFGSFKLRDDARQITLGTGIQDDPTFQTVTRLLLLPLAPTRLPDDAPRPKTDTRAGTGLPEH